MTSDISFKSTIPLKLLLKIVVPLGKVASKKYIVAKS